MKRYLGLTLDQAEQLAIAEGRKVVYHEETEDECAWLEISTAYGNGAGLEIEDGIVTEYEFLDWA